MNKLNNLYRQITPETKPVELAERVMAMSEKPAVHKRISFRPAVAVAAAAAAMSALVVTAGAANQWDYSAIFSQIFGEKAVNIEGNIVPEATIIKDEIENFDIELAAVAADKHGIIAIVDVTDKNGNFVTDENGELINIISDLWISMDLIDELGAYSSSTGSNVVWTEGNKARINVHTDVGDADLAGRRIDITARDKGAAEYGWIARCKIESTGEEIVYDKELSLESTDYNGKLCTIDVEEITVSPIALYIEGSGTGDFLGAVHNSESSYAVTENGEEIKFCTMGASARANDYGSLEEIMHFIFEEPVNPKEIVSVVLGDNVIELK